MCPALANGPSSVGALLALFFPLEAGPGGPPGPVPGGVAEAGWKSAVGPLLRQVALGWRSERRSYSGEVEWEDLVPAEDQPSVAILPVAESSPAECHTWSGTGLRLNST